MAFLAVLWLVGSLVELIRTVQGAVTNVRLMVDVRIWVNKDVEYQTKSEN